MKNKKLIIWGLVWSISLIVFNILVFVIPSNIAESKFESSSFWLCYVVIIMTYILQILFTISLLKKNSSQENNKNMFIKLTAEAEILCAYANTQIAKDATEKVYECFKYSDCVSCEDLHDLENKIKSTLNAFANAVKTKNEANIVKFSDELILLLKERNVRQKLTK